MSLITYLISKLLPLIFSPLGIIFVFLFFFLIKKKLKFIYSAIIVLLFFSNGIISDSLWRFLEYPWKRINYSLVNSADGIVVLSGTRHIPPGNSEIIEWLDPDRFIAGIELYRAEKAKNLIFTGGINPFYKNLPPEGDIYINEAVSMGIPREDIFTTNEVFNTFQEAKEIRKLLYKKINSRRKRIILVTSAFHMRRAKGIFEREGIDVIPYPVDFKSSKSLYPSLRNPLKWIPNVHYLAKSSSAIREIIGRIFYRTL